MTRQLSIAALAGSLLLAGGAEGGQAAPPRFPPSVTTRSASEALQFLLDFNIEPGGPLSGDGATIAGVLAGQSLTFPISSSSGAFVTRDLQGLGPSIGIASSGSFGPLFAERGLTNGARNLSVSVNYQHKQWRSMSGVALKGFDLKARAVFRNEVIGRGPEGTAEEFTADIDYRTDVFVLAANYGLLKSLDFGVSVPFVRASVDGVKRQVRYLPANGPTTVLAEQRVSGRSEGVGDVLTRWKYRLPIGSDKRQSRWNAERLQLAVGYDMRLPTGRTTDLYLDCRAPPCVGGDTQEVPDVGLGKLTHKVALLASASTGRFSPHFNLAHIWVPAYTCDESRFGNSGRCKGSIFEIDPANGTYDAKNQNLADEWNVTAGIDYELVAYKATLSMDVIARQLIDAGVFYEGPARVIIRSNGLDPSVTTQIESRPGHVNTLLGVASGKVGFRRRWVLVGSVLFPLNAQGLQPGLTWVLGLERAFGH
jgi:hypothetical protein